MNLVPMTIRDLVKVLGYGAIVGLIVAGIYILFSQFIFASALCQDPVSQDCQLAPSYSLTIAQIIGLIIGVGLLARQRIYRPLLIAFATFISFWTIHTLFVQLEWYQIVPLSAILFALAFATFAWFARIRSFLLTLIVTIILVVILRIAFA